MSYASTSFVGCENVQDTLDNIFETCDHFGYREPMPFLEFLLSPLGRTGLNAQIVPSPNRIRTVNLTYFQRLLESAVNENQANPNCSSTNDEGNCSTSFQIDTTENAQTDFRIGVNDLTQVCENDEFFFIKLIEKHISGLVRKVADTTASQVVPLLGQYSQHAQGVNAGRTILSVRTRKTAATEDPYPYTAEEIKRAAMVSNICNDPIIFGGQDLMSYYQQGALAGCCQNSGIDIAGIIREFGNVFMYDNWVVKALGGQEENIIVSPGSLALVTFTTSDRAVPFGDISLSNGNAGSLGVLFDPATGDRKSTRLNSSHSQQSRMPSSA